MESVELKNALEQVADIQVDPEDAMLLGVFLGQPLPLVTDQYRENVDRLVAQGLLKVVEEPSMIASRPANICYLATILGRVVHRREALRVRGETLFGHVAEELNAYFPERDEGMFDQVCLALAILEDSSEILQTTEHLNALEKKRKARWLIPPEKR